MLTWLALWGCPQTSPPVATAPDLPTAEPDRVRFVAIGDQGEANASQRLVAKAMGSVCAERGCDFAVLLGDNVYPRGFTSPEDDAFERYYDPYYPALGIPVLGVLGNHDYGHSTDDARAGWQLAHAATREELVMPGRYFQVRAGPAELFVLDTSPVFWGRHTEVQADWLDRELDESPARDLIVLAHHPLRSNGEHGNAGSYEGHPALPVANGARIEQLYRDHVCGRADLMLGGHDHNLQWLEHCGAQLLVSGAGSKTTPLVDRGNPARFQASTEGLVWVELTADALTAAFYDQHGALLFEDQVAR